MPKKIQDKVKTTRIKKVDRDRLMKKSVSAGVGKYDLSESSAEAALETVYRYDEQEKQDKRNAGSRPKKREGFRQAALQILKSNPTISLHDAWEMLDGFEIDPHWSFYRDGDDMIQNYHGRNKNQAPVVAMKKNTFRTQYFYPAREKINQADK